MRTSPERVTCGTGLGKQIDRVDQTGQQSNLPSSRLGPLVVLDIKLKELIAKLHDHALGQRKKIK